MNRYEISRSLEMTCQGEVMQTNTEPVIDTCEACQNWGANHGHDHEITVKQDKESKDEQIVPVYTQKIEE